MKKEISLSYNLIMKGFAFLLSVGLVLLSACGPKTDYKVIVSDTDLYHKSINNLTAVSVHDIFSPPVAARIYVYPNIAAYEIMRQQDAQNYKSLANQLTDLKAVPQNKDTRVDYQIAALHAFHIVSRTLIYSEDKLNAFQAEEFKALRKQGVPKKVLKASKKYGERVAAHILDWAKQDMYHQTRTYPKYTIQQETAYWKPTPPDYMDGIEPNWKHIRPMMLKSAHQFPAPAPHPVSLKQNSPFFKQLMDVYRAGKNLSPEQLEIASFWDCNPYVSHHKGHAMFATKKMTPGGHWIGITGIATKKAKLNFLKTVEAYTRVSIAMFDAFIICWEEKWRSLVVRPETLINEHIDEDWLPVLQTPPFPEYTSGHSVVSTAAAKILTDYFGENFSFVDDTEVIYGLPERSFESFEKAAAEAAISRFYGGIHYMMAIEAGVQQGKALGDYLIEGLQTEQKNSLALKATQKY